MAAPKILVDDEPTVADDGKGFPAGDVSLSFWRGFPPKEHS